MGGVRSILFFNFAKPFSEHLEILNFSFWSQLNISEHFQFYNISEHSQMVLKLFTNGRFDHIIFQPRLKPPRKKVTQETH